MPKAKANEPKEEPKVEASVEGSKPEEVKVPVVEKLAEEVKPEEPVEEVPEPHLEKYTADIRENPVFKVDFNAENVQALLDQYEADGKQIVQLYCTDPQAEAIRDMKKFKDIQLVQA